MNKKPTHKYSDVSFENYLSEQFGLVEKQYKKALKEQENEIKKPKIKKVKKHRAKTKLRKNRNSRATPIKRR